MLNLEMSRYMFLLWVIQYYKVADGLNRGCPTYHTDDKDSQSPSIDKAGAFKGHQIQRK